ESPCRFVKSALRAGIAAKSPHCARAPARGSFTFESHESARPFPAPALGFARTAHPGAQPMSTATLLSAYVLSFVALIFFIIGMVRGWFDSDESAAHVIFAPNEEGHTEDPAASPEARRALQRSAGAPRTAPDSEELTARIAADDSSRLLVFILMAASLC